MSMETEPLTYVCDCSTKKERRLFFDGGKTGNYITELCLKCYQSFDKKFLLSEDIIP